jgi:hypothetical protein
VVDGSFIVACGYNCWFSLVLPKLIAIGACCLIFVSWESWLINVDPRLMLIDSMVQIMDSIIFFESNDT